MEEALPQVEQTGLLRGARCTEPAPTQEAQGERKVSAG